MGFLIFILVNATLFVRPAEIAPNLEAVPIYNALMILGLLVSMPAVLSRLSGRALSEQPITVCVLGVGAMVVISNLAHFDTWTAREKGLEFGKIILYYLLMIATVNTPARLDKFLTWLTIFIITLTTLSLLHYHGYITVPALEALERLDIDEESGEEETILQLRSTGLFNDPNDFCLILVLGIVLAFGRLTNRDLGSVRALWIIPAGICFYALLLTRSRGGLIGLMTAIMTFMMARFGWRRSIPLGLVVLPCLLVLVGGRQARISSDEDTAQERLQLWSEGLSLLKRTPLTGIGAGNFSEELGLVAHNSYVHSYTELGLVGGSLFVALFYLPIWTLSRLGRRDVQIFDPRMRHMRPYLMGAVAGYAGCLFSLSRCYIPPTYLLPGITVAYLQSISLNTPEVIPKLDNSLVKRLSIVGVVTLLSLYAFTKVFVQWG